MAQEAARHRRAWVVAAAAAIFCLGVAPTPRSKLPARIAWQRGSCANCRTAQHVTDIGFATGHVLWAFGYGPPGGAGEGDWTILRSGDDGGSWHELPWTYQHNLSPRLSF